MYTHWEGRSWRTTRVLYSVFTACSAHVTRPFSHGHILSEQLRLRATTTNVAVSQCCCCHTVVVTARHSSDSTVIESRYDRVEITSDVTMAT